MHRLIVVFLLLSSSSYANPKVICGDTLPCDTTVHVSRTFCPHCEAWGEIFSPDFTGKLPIEFQMKIYDPDGTEVFSTSYIDIGWNGFVKENDQQVVICTWKITYRYEKEGSIYECKGELILIP